MERLKDRVTGECLTEVFNNRRRIFRIRLTIGRVKIVLEFDPHSVTRKLTKRQGVDRNIAAHEIRAFKRKRPRLNHRGLSRPRS